MTVSAKTKFRITNLVFALLFFIVGFPKISLVCGTGLDDGYKWALNWLFINDYDTLTQLTYPLGPLAFLKSPLYFGNNFYYSLIFFTITKISLLYLLLDERKENSSGIIFLTLVLSYFTNNIDFVLIPLSILLCFKLLQKFSWYTFGISCLVVIIGLFIKLSIGIVTCSVLLAYLFMDFLDHKNWKLSSKKSGVFLVAFIVFGLIIFRSFGIFIHYIYTSLILSAGYSESLTLYPENNWWSLGIFLISSVIFFVLTRNKPSYQFLGLCIFSVFAIWKHALTREDFGHFIQFMEYMILIWSLFFILVKDIKPYTLLFPILGVLCLYYNSSQLPYFNGYPIEFSGTDQFIKVFFDAENFKKEQEKISLEYLQKQSLDVETRKIIGNKSVDIYPWEISYAAANDLNYQPRQSLEIGASSSQKIAEIAAKNYSETGPEFVIFHFVTDNYEGQFGSIDGKHILSNESKVLINLFKNYTVIKKTDQFLLFKKDIKNLSTQKGETKKGKFNSWIDVPKEDKNIVLCKIDFSNTFLGSLKKTFYKQEQYFMDYQLENGKILSYRILPFSIRNGIWCNPLIRFPKNDFPEMLVSKIRIRHENPIFTKEEIKYCFETFSFSQNKEELSLNKIIGKKEAVKDSIYYTNSIQKTLNPEKLNKEYKVEKESFLGEINFNTQEIWAKVDNSISDLVLNYSIIYKNVDSEALHAIIIDGEWKGENMPQTKDWKEINQQIILNRYQHSKSEVKLHIWNKGTAEIEVKEFKLSIGTETLF